ncbi:MAG: hypothetical protein IIW17_09280 [Clostridia bacterium]|nr:hypothetical protein [Bacteroidales bacterium]MBQ5794196.1 hypothetical protein [Clostridia bacterium]
MTHIDYFKLQAKNFIRDFKTQEIDETGITHYTPKFFPDIDDIILAYDLDKKHFTLMNAQHIIALLAGFDNWADLLHSSEARLELGKLLFDYRRIDFNILDRWDFILADLPPMDDESKLNIFNAIVLNKFE